MTVFFPVVRKASQQAALHERRSLGGMQYSVTRLKKGGLFQYLTGQGGRRAGRMGGGSGFLRPGQVYRQVGVPAQGQAGEVGRQVLWAVVQAGAGFKQAQAHFVHLASQKAGVFGHASGYHKGGRGQSPRQSSRQTV